jgi:hypothetical protein
MKKNLTKQQRLHNALGCQKAEEYKSVHAYLHGAFLCREEFDVFWHKSDNTTWAHQFGRMVGWDELYYNGVVHCETMGAMMAGDLMKRYKEYWGHDLRSVGKSGAHALASDVREVADDGKSVRLYYLTPGTLMGPVGFDGQHRGGVWLWERYGSEFVFADGEWMWFHEHVCPDIVGDYDIQNWAHDRYEQHVAGTLERGELGGFPDRLTEPGITHWDWSPVQVPQDTVPPPKPYKTLDDDNTYSPGRTDPTGKNTIKTEGSQKMNWGKTVADIAPPTGIDDIADGGPGGPPPGGPPPGGPGGPPSGSPGAQ